MLSVPSSRLILATPLHRPVCTCSVPTELEMAGRDNAGERRLISSDQVQQLKNVKITFVDFEKKVNKTYIVLQTTESIWRE